MRDAFSERTKFVLLNSPHNPTGVMVHEEDLAVLAEQCVAHNTYAVADEVCCPCSARQPVGAGA